MKNIKDSRALKPVGAGLIAAVCLAAALRRIFINVHIDEEVMVALGLRVLRGDRFLTQIQEPQLLLAPLLALFEIPWLALTGGTVGLYVYMKVITAAILAAASWFTYKTVKDAYGTAAGLIAALMCFFFHFRYVNVVDYTLLYDLSFLCCILTVVSFDRLKHKTLAAAAVGVMISAAVISLPSAVLLFPIVIVLLLLRPEGKRAVPLILLICAALGLAECIVIFRSVQPADIPRLLRGMVSGSTYMKKESNGSMKIIQVLLCLLFIPFTKFQRTLSDRLLGFFAEGKKTRVFAQLAALVIIAAGTLRLLFYTVWRQGFYSKDGYYMILLGGFVIASLLERDERLRLMFFFGILTDISASVMIHYETQCMYALPSFIALALMLVRLDLFRSIRPAAYAVCFGAVLFLLFSKDVLLISNSTYGRETLFNQQLVRLTVGPAAGAYERERDAEKYNELYDWINNNIEEPTKVCCFGKNVLLYAMSDNIEACVPQLFMDYSDETVLPEYYSEYPDQLPDIVIIDVSPNTKIEVKPAETEIFAGYTKIYESGNYLIYES